jgi:hypothetical protein
MSLNRYAANAATAVFVAASSVAAQTQAISVEKWPETFLAMF